MSRKKKTKDILLPNNLTKKKIKISNRSKRRKISVNSGFVSDDISNEEIEEMFKKIEKPLVSDLNTDTDTDISIKDEEEFSKPKSNSQKRKRVGKYELDDEYVYDNEECYDDFDYDCIDLGNVLSYDKAQWNRKLLKLNKMGGSMFNDTREGLSGRRKGVNANFNDSKYIHIKEIFVDPVERDLYTLKVRRHVMSYDPLIRHVIEIPKVYPCQLPVSFAIPFVGQKNVIKEVEGKSKKEYPQSKITVFRDDEKVGFEGGLTDHYILADPFKFDYFDKQFQFLFSIDCIYVCCNFEENGFDYQKFENLPFGNGEDTIIDYGHLFIWIPQGFFGRVYNTCKQWGFEYIEQCTWVKLDEDGSIVRFEQNDDPLKRKKEFNESCLMLYSFRKGSFTGSTNKRNKRKEKAHQRIPDVFQDFQVKGLPHKYCLNLINNLLPGAKNKLWLWGSCEFTITEKCNDWHVMIDPKYYESFIKKQSNEKSLKKRMKKTIIKRYDE